MDSAETKVIIEKSPKTPWYKEWIPITIAIVTLFTSLISLNWTRKEITKEIDHTFGRQIME